MELQRFGRANPNQDVVPAVTEGERDWSFLVQCLNRTPTRLKDSAGDISCCIFKVPEVFAKINANAYRPHLVSIGPYHHGTKCVQMIEEHKPRFFSAILARTNCSGVNFNHYFNAIAKKEREILDCYSEILNFGSSELIQMMVLDGCFIIEVFRVVKGIVKKEPNDPIFSMVWMFSAFMRDFLQLENQIPFSILQMLYDMSKLPTDPPYSLVELALEFFNYGMQRQSKILEKHYGVSEAKHLLHLIQLTLIGPAPEAPTESNEDYLQLVHSVAKLRRAGIKFKPRKGHEWLEIWFNNGVLEIPQLKIDDLTSSLFLNCVAFEQCYCLRSRHITTYITFIGWLMNSADDVSYLSDHHVLENHYGPDAEVVRFFNDITKHVVFDIKKCYLAGEIEELNRYYSSWWRVRWTGLKLTYFGTPWSFISALAASIILILTFIQSFFAIYSGVHGSKN